MADQLNTQEQSIQKKERATIHENSTKQLILCIVFSVTVIAEYFIPKYSGIYWCLFAVLLLCLLGIIYTSGI